ncbi:MAG: iron-sulfur cluster repair di-iron protein [bacterium]|nr:iron-sulfur cluster repair di-iron protein [bacterium]
MSFILTECLFDYLCIWMLLLNKKIGTLIEEDFVIARALHYLGVDFLFHADKTIIQICKERKLPLKNVLQTLDSFHNSRTTYKKNLEAYPLDLVIGYLKHAHHIFIKERLPYVLNLINQIDTNQVSNKAVLSDLQLIFPVFVEDFIKHIYEEEDTVFEYILKLNQVIQSDYTTIGKFIYTNKVISLKDVAQHHDEEDEMEGLREMVNSLKNIDNDDLTVKLVVAELQNFDLEMLNHAKVENEILFPRACQLENELQRISKLISQQN